MDEETRELIQRLCTKAGMIMEDSIAVAISLQAREAKETHAKLLRLSAASETTSALIAAADALSRFP
jgi:hypothetical protein